MPSVPTEIRTERLVLKRWAPEHASALLPLLEGASEHLRWIPERVSKPAPIPELQERLEGFAADFDADKEWRYAVHIAANNQLIGEIALFPRTAAARVPITEADRVEIGYWLSAEATGQGFATEATRVLIELARTLNGMTAIEIRCDRRNLPSVAIPQRLGFKLERIDADKPDTQVWYSEIP